MDRYGCSTILFAALCREIESVASELERMSAGSSGRLTVPTADRMRLQLDDMLEQRTTAEALQAEVQRRQFTANLLEQECCKLRVAQSEVGPLFSLPDFTFTLCPPIVLGLWQSVVTAFSAKQSEHPTAA